MAEWSKALRSGRSPLLWAWVRIPLLTNIFPLIKKFRAIINLCFYPHQHTDSRVAQWKRAGPITQRSVDRNYALLTFLGSDFNFNIEKTDSSIFQNIPNPVRMAEWSKAPDSRYTALLP